MLLFLCCSLGLAMFHYSFSNSVFIDDEHNAESGSGEIGNSSGEKTKPDSADEAKDKDTAKNGGTDKGYCDIRVFLWIVGAVELLM